jgi:hypothetical protein
MKAEVHRALQGFRWYELIPEAVLVAGLTWFLVDETDAATSAFASTKAVVLMAVVATAWIVLRVLFALLVRWPVVRMVAFGAAAVAVLAVVVLPAYDDTTVVESFPEAAADPAPPPSTAPGAPTTATTAPAAPVVLGTGMLEGIDHDAMGTVRIYERPDGGHVVGLEDIDVQPGPDYDVYVVPGADRDQLDGATRLDDLRGNQGTQFYDVAGADLTAGAWTVLIWCQTFDVPIANATPV